MSILESLSVGDLSLGDYESMRHRARPFRELTSSTLSTFQTEITGQIGLAESHVAIFCLKIRYVPNNVDICHKLR